MAPVSRLSKNQRKNRRISTIRPPRSSCSARATRWPWYRGQKKPRRRWGSLSTNPFRCGSRSPGETPWTVTRFKQILSRIVTASSFGLPFSLEPLRQATGLFLCVRRTFEGTCWTQVDGVGKRTKDVCPAHLPRPRYPDGSPTGASLRDGQ
jgi:hypothetical protein